MHNVRSEFAQRKPVAGWYWAQCDDCKVTWREASRDICSPSHVDCPSGCDHGGQTTVWKTSVDPALARDAHGNLLCARRIVLSRGMWQTEEDL